MITLDPHSCPADIQPFPNTLVIPLGAYIIKASSGALSILHCNDPEARYTPHLLNVHQNNIYLEPRSLRIYEGNGCY